MRIIDFLVIIGAVVLWYGLVPAAGAFVKRYQWRRFRQRFDELRLRPVLDYRRCRQLGEEEAGEFRFIGGFESVTDGQTLWIRGEDLTVPVALADAQTWLLPVQQGEGDGEETPERIRWNRVSALAEGARVFVGGSLVLRDKRRFFVSSRENPLIVIFFDGPDRSLTPRTMWASRSRNEYWNAATPYSLAIGAVCQILIALSFLSRPAYRLTVISALAALFIPLFPLIPPGLLFTVVYRRLSWRARLLRSYRDLVRLPLRYLAPNRESGQLPGGEWYGLARFDSLPAEAREGKIPFPLPEFSPGKAGKNWYVFGALQTPPGQAPGGQASGGQTPTQPEDPFATFGIVPGNPEALARRFTATAYTLEAAAWLLLLAGISLNIFFLRMILTLL